VKIITKVTLGQLETIARHLPETVICYAMSTCWWCCKDQLTPQDDAGIPCDPRGSVLMETTLGFYLRDAKASPDHYGKHGLNAFVAGYDGNLLNDKGKPTSFETWDEYNDLLDRQGVEDAPKHV
jgi:hypothetical protein